MTFVEPLPEIVTANPGGALDPLGESVLDPVHPWIRVFSPSDTRVVIGRGQDPRRECLVEHCRADGVPIHRRASGGGAVVLAPRMVVVAIRLRHGQVGTDCYFDLVNGALVPAVAAVAGVAPTCRGHGDLTLVGDDGRPRKILGASLRQNTGSAGRQVVYLGVFLVGDGVPLMERYLAQPSREPDYRGGRGHGDFCTSLDRHGVAAADLVASIEQQCHRHLGSHALT